MYARPPIDGPRITSGKGKGRRAPWPCPDQSRPGRGPEPGVAGRMGIWDWMGDGISPPPLLPSDSGEGLEHPSIPPPSASRSMPIRPRRSPGVSPIRRHAAASASAIARRASRSTRPGAGPSHRCHRRPPSLVIGPVSARAGCPPRGTGGEGIGSATPQWGGRGTKHFGRPPPPPTGGDPGYRTPIVGGNMRRPP